VGIIQVNLGKVNMSSKTAIESAPPARVESQRASIGANMISTLLLRIASRSSFVLLGFYLGEHVESAALVVIILEAFYVSELVAAPLIGSLSDGIGRKPFLLLAPLLGAGAALSFLISAQFFPAPNIEIIDAQLITLLALILAGRLLEGAATGVNTPASLGHIADTTVGSEKLRARVMTAFEVATVGGLALAIPFAGQVGARMGYWGFTIVIILHAINIIVVATLLKEGQALTHNEEKHGSLFEGLKMLRLPKIFTFLPAWLAINAMVGAWITLCTIILTYPNPAADLRHPGQLLYGGFSKDFGTMMIGLFGLVFLLGMAGWMFILPRLRRTTIMSLGLVGAAISIGGLLVINAMAENPARLLPGSNLQMAALLALVGAGILLLSGFTPAALTQIAAIADTQPGKRGAVMGLYSVVLAVGQLSGAGIGGVFVDWNGFTGLMIFSVILGFIALASVWYMRSHKHDMLAIHVGH
jgi:MFS family permease